MSIGITDFPTTSQQIEAAKRRLRTLYKTRNLLYAQHLLAVDERIRQAENELFQLERKPRPRCLKCGHEIATPYEGCCNENCENYEGIPF